MKKTVRHIDDMKDGGQNDSSHSNFTHIPADPDRVIIMLSKLQDLFPKEPIDGLASDYNSAYNQKTGDPDMAHLLTVGRWDPITERIAYWQPLTQLFGGRVAGLNFCRCPSFACFLIAALFNTPADHCVDDVIMVMIRALALNSYRCWRALASLLGWDVPDDKSPLPSAYIRALGVIFNLLGLPSWSHYH